MKSPAKRKSPAKGKTSGKKISKIKKTKNDDIVNDDTDMEIVKENIKVN
jgi:hypothetical protein